MVTVASLINQWYIIAMSKTLITIEQPGSLTRNDWQTVKRLLAKPIAKFDLWSLQAFVKEVDATGSAHIELDDLNCIGQILSQQTMDESGNYRASSAVPGAAEQFLQIVHLANHQDKIDGAPKVVGRLKMGTYDVEVMRYPFKAGSGFLGLPIPSCVAFIDGRISCIWATSVERVLFQAAARLNYEGHIEIEGDDAEVA